MVASKGEILTLEEKEAISLLNRMEYLNLRQISEPRENTLSIIIEEAVIDRSETVIARDPTSPLAEIMKDTSPIRTTDRCKTLELRWDRYVAYLVTEELVASGASRQDEVYTGNVFRVYTKSHFLDYLSGNTSGHIEPILHYEVVCQNHLIDVASYRPPEIRLLGVPSESETKVRPN